MQDFIKEIISLRMVIKEIDDVKGVKLEGRSHGKVEEIFQQLHGTPPTFANTLIYLMRIMTCFMSLMMHLWWS